MKKNFFAKLGHFFLVSAVLFNTFGVAFVHAKPEILGTSQYTTTLTEGDSNPVSLVTISNSATTTIDLTFSFSDGVAVRGADGTGDFELYVGEGSPFGTSETNLISVPAEGSVNFPINIIDDAIPESDESFGLTFETATYQDGVRTPVEGFSSRGAINFTIHDNDIDSNTFVPSFSPVTSAVYEGAATGAKVTKLINNSVVDLTYTIGLTGDATLGQNFGLFVIDDNNSTEITDSNSFNITISANSISTFSVYTNGSYENSNFDNVAKKTTWTVTKVNYGTSDYDLSSNSINFTLDIKDDENSLYFLKNSTSVNESTSLNDSTATYAGGRKMAYYNETENDIALTFDLSGTANSSTDYNVRTDELSSENVWIVPKNTVKSFPINTLDVDGEKTLILTITQIDLLNDDGSIKNADINSTLSGYQKQTLTILDTDNSGRNNSGPTNNDPTVVGEGILDIEVVMGYGDMISSTTLATYFTDIDNDDLTFTATSSDSNNITAVMDNGDLVVLSTNTNVTSAEITVTADDGNGGTVGNKFLVNVIGNEVSFDITSDDVSEGVGTYTVNLHSLKPAKDSGAGAPEGEIGNSTVVAYFKVNSSTATNINDYTILASVSDSEVDSLYIVEIPVNSTSTSFDITINDDSDIESVEFLNLELVMGKDTAYVNESANTFILTINDNDSSEIPVTPPVTNHGGGSTLLPNTAPQASVTNGQEVTVEVNKEITFDASGSSDAENNIRFYFWNFGDSSDEVYFTTPTTTHTYTKVGTYTLTIKVRDAYGAESSAEIKVKVVEGKKVVTETTKEPVKTPEKTTDTTPVKETATIPTTGSTGNTNTNTNPVNNNTTPENTETAEEENTTEEPKNTEENNTSENGSTTKENVEEPTNEENQELPTWIKIIFGSGALAAVAGAGIAINRVRKNM